MQRRREDTCLRLHSFLSLRLSLYLSFGLILGISLRLLLKTYGSLDPGNFLKALSPADSSSLTLDPNEQIHHL